MTSSPYANSTDDLHHAACRFRDRDRPRALPRVSHRAGERHLASMDDDLEVARVDPRVVGEHPTDLVADALVAALPVLRSAGLGHPLAEVDTLGPSMVVLHARDVV